MITFREIKLLFIALIFGIGYWFVMTGFKEYFDYTGITSILIGFGVLGLLLFFYKYRGIFSLGV